MIHRILHKLKTINPWHFLWIAILISILFTLILNTIQSYLWWGFLSRDLLLIGIIDSFFVPLLVGPIVIYFVWHTAQLEELNKALELEIIRVRENEREKGRETEALYQILFENAPVGIGISDMNGTLIAFNEAMLGPGGYAREDMATITNVSELYYNVQERESALAVFRKQGFLHKFPVQFKRRDGTPYDALLNLRPTTYQGRPCIQALVEDVTERKRIQEELEKNERRYRQLFEDSPIALCETDTAAVKQYLASLQDSGAGDMRTYFEHHPESVRQCAALMSVVDMNTAMLELFGANTKEDLRNNLATIFHEESYDLFREDMLMFMTDRKSYEHESVAQTLAGEKIHIFIKWFWESGDHDRKDRVIVSFIDITSLKQTERTLEESKERLRFALLSADLGMWDWDITTGRGIVTPENQRLFGLPESILEPHAEDYTALIHSDDKERVSNAFISAGEMESSYDSEYRICCTDGTGRWIHSIGKHLLFPDGHLHFVGISQDITDRKRAEEALRESEERLRTLSDNVPSGLVYQIDTGEDGQQRRFSYISAGVEQLHGIAVGEAMSDAMSIYGQVVAEDRIRLAEEEASALANMVPFDTEVRLQLPSGELRWRFFASAPRRLPNNHLVWDGIEIDITERKHAEKSLTESREWFRKLVAKMNDGFGIQDETGMITYVNERLCTMLGYSADELIGKQLSAFLDETYRKVLEERVAIRKTGDRSSYDLRWTKKTGDFVFTLVSPEPLFDESGRYKGSFATITDITERKQLEQALKESEDRFRIALLNSPIVVFNQDRNLRFTWIHNPRHGYLQEDVIGKKDSDLFDIEDPARLAEIKQRVIETGTREREEVRIERAGEIMYYDSSFEPLYDPDGVIIGLTCVAIDITSRKRQEELINSYQAQLSLLASKLSLVEEKERRRIAKDLHDNIGQILACAKLKLGELNKSCDADSKPHIRQIYSLVEQSILYTRSLTAELSVPILYEMGLEPAVAWLGREFQKNHSVHFHLRDDGASKPLNDDMRIVLFKAVRELLTNVAKHAHAKNVAVSLARNDGAMQVTVEDDGVGFDVADVQKSPRIQSCFGLFSIREALKNSGGSIEITSAPGRTTRITLTAPLEVTPPNPLLTQEGE